MMTDVHVAILSKPLHICHKKKLPWQSSLASQNGATGGTAAPAATAALVPVVEYTTTAHALTAALRRRWITSHQPCNDLNTCAGDRVSYLLVEYIAPPALMKE